MLFQVFSRFSVFGFSGSRSRVPRGAAALAVACVPRDAAVLVGCQRGVDAFFRSAFPSAQVFLASSYGSGRSAFVARSIACISAVRAAGGLWVSFPSSPYPSGLVPSSRASVCFCGTGSGSWASLAFAVGSGCSALVFLPGSAPPPWGFVQVCTGWYYASPGTASVQLQLF